MDYWTTLGAVATVVIPVAVLQARNTKLQIEKAILASEALVLVTADKLYVRKEVCAVAMGRPLSGNGD